jgi:hypothetical protein
MKVKEFIEILQQYDPDLEVNFIWDTCNWDAESIFRRDEELCIEVTGREIEKPNIYPAYPFEVELEIDEVKHEFVINIDFSFEFDEILKVVEKDIMSRFSLDKKDLEDLKVEIWPIPDDSGKSWWYHQLEKRDEQLSGISG